MGSEDLFHKRKAKAADRLGRRKAKRASYDKVLIVCEGEKTEPNYFNELVDFYEINSANVDIDGTCGSSPKSVFERACSLYQAEIIKGDPFDRVYCVFDKDSHETYESTINKIRSNGYKSVFYATTSVPCFEYWLILHFKYTTKPYAATRSSSVGDAVLKDLVKVMPTYAKGSTGIFSLLHGQLEYAKNNSIRAKLHSEKNDSDNPSTSIHNLIIYLQGIKGDTGTG